MKNIIKIYKLNEIKFMVILIHKFNCIEHLFNLIFK